MNALLRRTLLCVLFPPAAGVLAAALPDTGQDTCYNDTAADTAASTSAASIARDAGTHPRQDCRFGRDAAVTANALPKTGSGPRGFDYTKIANNGTEASDTAALGAAATDWACTRDNVTGLTWEVKTAITTDQRYAGRTYTWNNTNGATNAGNAGLACAPAASGIVCSTETFVAVVNAAALCTHVDWRMPTQRELETLIDFGSTSPTISLDWFPNTTTSLPYWTGSSYIETTSLAWSVDFRVPLTGTTSKVSGERLPVRLVRGAAF